MIIICIIVHLSKTLEFTAPRVKRNVNHGLWMIMMYLLSAGSLIEKKKCISLVGNVGSKGYYALVQEGCT